MTKFLTTDQVAETVQLHRETIARYIREGKIQAVKFGRVWRIQQEEFERIPKEGINNNYKYKTREGCK